MNKQIKKHINNKGFTLIELLITISLMSVLALLGFSSLANSINSQNMNHAAKQLAFGINKARYYAKTKGEITHIEIDTDSNTYEITANEASLINNNSIDGTSGVLPENINIQENTCGDLYFYIDGTPLNSIDPVTQLNHSCSISVGPNSKKTKKISILPYSGRVVNE
ncbi:MAG: Tfp pilus assembly protein FimT/FimU [Vampirovibrionia bacterium]